MNANRPQRYGRACPGHPRLRKDDGQSVDARDKRWHDEEKTEALG
jgi:hypothetical protein